MCGCCWYETWFIVPLSSPEGLLCDLLWSDPDKDVQGWGENDRGVSFTFGADVVSKFLNRHDLDLICRAHQVPGPYNTHTHTHTLLKPCFWRVCVYVCVL